MAQLIRLGEYVTIGTTPVEFRIAENETNLSINPPEALAIETPSSNSGTVQFCVGLTPPASQAGYPGGSKIVIHGVGGGRNLWAVASALNQNFIVT